MVKQGLDYIVSLSKKNNFLKYKIIKNNKNY